MKKAIILFLGIMSFAFVKANDRTISSEITTLKYNKNVVTFKEKGVLFHVFLGGDFEFSNINRNRRFVPIRVHRNFKGYINKVGLNSIKYNRRGKVTRIGNVRLYYKNGFISRIGNLKIKYNRFGSPYFYGRVNSHEYYDTNFNYSLNIGQIFNYNDRFFTHRSFKNNYRKFNEDRYYFYYRAKKNAKVAKDKKIIKRRKSKIIKRDSRSNNKRNSNKTYRKRRS